MHRRDLLSSVRPCEWQDFSTSTVCIKNVHRVLEVERQCLTTLSMTTWWKCSHSSIRHDCSWSTSRIWLRYARSCRFTDGSAAGRFGRWVWYEKVAFGVQIKALIFLKRDEIALRLPCIKANRKCYTRFRLVPKLTTLDDLEGSLYILSQNTCVLRSSPRKFECR